MLDMNDKAALNVLAEPASDRSSKSLDPCFESASEKLLNDVADLVIKHADCRCTGNRLTLQSAHDIRQGIALLLSLYEVRQVP